MVCVNLSGLLSLVTLLGFTLGLLVGMSLSDLKFSNLKFNKKHWKKVIEGGK